MVHTNIRPYVLFSKYGTLNFLNHSNEHYHKVAMIHTASVASDMNALPWGSIYSGTKRFNDIFATLLNQGNKKHSDSKNLIVTQILKPAVTTTRLAYFMERWHSSNVTEVVDGSLADIGRNSTAIYGSLKHAYLG